MTNDNDYIDMDDFLGDISVDIKKAYIDVNFLTPYQLKIKSDAILEKLPLFHNTSGPLSSNWNERLSEEFDIFNILKENYKHSVGFLVFNDLAHKLNNTRLWNCNFYPNKGMKNSQKLEIRLPVRYPKQIPEVARASTDFHATLYNKCFGILKKRWREDGKYGIPHFLIMIGLYYALEWNSERIK